MKSNLELVQELLENRLDTLNDKIDVNNHNLGEKIDTNNDNVLELLNFIREQTTKTNGRLLRAEEEIKDLNKQNSNHYIMCPNIGEIRNDIIDVKSRVKQMEDDSFILRIFNKYPKQLIAGFAVIVAIFIGSAAYGIYEFHNMTKTLNQDTQLIQKNEIH